MRKPWPRITGLFLSGIVFVLASCGTVSTHPSKVRSLPDEVRTTLSIGDTRDKVHTLLGKPLIDAKDQRLEVYRFAGRDIDIDLTPFPLPLPGEKVTADVLVLYDKEDKIKDIASHTVAHLISAGGYRFLNYAYIYRHERETLIGPPISWDEISQKSVQDGKCLLVLLMGECPMEIVSLDNKQIVDLSPAGAECGEFYSDFHDRFIKKSITPGVHRLVVTQRTRVQERDFKADFECSNGETIYAELDVDVTWHELGNGIRGKWVMNGDLSISNAPQKKHMIDKSGLSPILWHKGEWYGPTSTDSSVKQ